MNVFSLIRESCSRVARQAFHVQINADRLKKYLDFLVKACPDTLQMDEENHFCGDERLTFNYFLVLDAINFGSGYFKHLEKTIPGSGYFTVANLLKQELLRRNGFDCDFLSSINYKDCCSIFKQSNNNEHILPLMKQFAVALNQLGAFVRERFAGDFCALVESAQNCARELVSLLAEMSCFEDHAVYKAEKVYFYKRAQITVSDLNIAFNGKSFGRFSDIEQLTIFADNLVPHVLWIDGVLKYSDSLQAKIHRQEEIEAFSCEEIELRACAIHAVEMLVAEAKKRNKPMTAQQFDYILWNHGQNQKFRKIPPHITKSIFY
jgi:hypothetical protein